MLQQIHVILLILKFSKDFTLFLATFGKKLYQAIVYVRRLYVFAMMGASGLVSHCDVIQTCIAAIDVTSLTVAGKLLMRQS